MKPTGPTAPISSTRIFPSSHPGYIITSHQVPGAAAMNNKPHHPDSQGCRILRRVLIYRKDALIN